MKLDIEHSQTNRQLYFLYDTLLLLLYIYIYTYIHIYIYTYIYIHIYIRLQKGRSNKDGWMGWMQCDGIGWIGWMEMHNVVGSWLRYIFLFRGDTL